MHSVMQIEIAAPREAVYAAAADLERWPDFLAHYRFNRTLAPHRSGHGGIVRMSALRSGIPLTWTSVYRRDPENLHMHFEHLKPLTRGMVVRWDFVPVPGTPDRTQVEILHDFVLPWPVVGKWIADRVIGNLLVEHIAGLTLRGLKRHVEGRIEGRAS